MFRFIAFAALLTATALSSCSGGGSVLNFSGNTKPDHVIVTVAGPVNIARVLPGAGLALAAVQVNGSQNGLLTGNNYRWSAELTTGGFYVSDTSGTMKPCATVTVTTGAVTTPMTADFGIYIAIDPVNEANILFIPPTVLEPPAGSTVTVHYPYCVTVSAEPGTITGSGLQTRFNPTGPPGSITVAVVDPQNPLQ